LIAALAGLDPNYGKLRDAVAPSFRPVASQSKIAIGVSAIGLLKNPCSCLVIRALLAER
jgi:hypothetical protein